MNSEGKVRVVVNSQRVAVGTTTFSWPIFSTSGIYIGTTRNRVVLYDSRLNDEQIRAIDEGQRVSRDLGLRLEVVDRSKSNFKTRIRSFLGFADSRRPELLVTPYSTRTGVVEVPDVNPIDSC
jgi:hypothetical protein